jgi:diguanylate cyclase (GGDEF)-like protein
VITPDAFALTPDGGAAEAVVERVRGRHLERVDVLERAVLALMDGTLTDELRELAESEAHALAGAMPTFGVRTGVRIARALEQSFAARYTLERGLAARLADQVVALRTELERPLDAGAGAAEGVQRPRFVLLAADVEQRDRYVTEGMASGAEVTPVDFTTDVDVVRRMAPRAIVVELPDHPSPQALAGLRRMARVGVPILVIGGDGGLAERLAIARSRAVGPLARPASPSDVLQHAARLAEERRVQPGTVLVVDTDPYGAQTARFALERAGHLVYTLFDPERVWETLETVVPELMLVGARLGACSGVELALATRADPRWRDLPVILAAAAHEEAFVREAYVDGIDDVVRKPLDPRLLTARVHNRLRLSRQLRRRDETDPVTGLSSRSKAEREFERLLRLARRHAQRFALLSVRLDRYDELRGRHGQALVDAAMRRLAQLLRETFRGEDVIASWGGGELVVGLFDADAIIARERARTIMTAMRATRLTGAAGSALTLSCSVGISSVPDVPADLALLHAAADSALLMAGAHTTDAVLAVASDPGEQSTGRVDVLLVDDDPASASLVLHALEGRRYSVRWMRDGAEAAAALTGDQPALSARVIILEVNLPSLDGLSVLRTLAAAHALRRTRIVMLSPRNSDAETLQAFELGAFDYVPKPFSVAVLVERVRRALVA